MCVCVCVCVCLCVCVCVCVYVCVCVCMCMVLDDQKIMKKDKQLHFHIQHCNQVEKKKQKEA